MAETLGPVLGSWAARCRKAPGTLVLTAGARLVHVANDGPRTEIELSEGVELEVTKPRASALALARLSNLSEDLGSRLVIEFVEDFTGNPNQKWSNLREFSELMHGLLAKKPAKQPEKSSVPENSLAMQYTYLVEQTAVMTPEKFMEIHSREIAQNAPLPEAPSIDSAPLRVVAAAQRNQRETGKGENHLSETDKAAIFQELPALSQLFSAAVPSMMTANQFWDRCLKSRYFLHAAGAGHCHSHPEDRLFDSLPPPQPLVEPTDMSGRNQRGHPEADLTGEFQRESLGSASASASASATLISRLNERSAGILSQETGEKGEKKSDKGEKKNQEKTSKDLSFAVEKRRQMLRSAAQSLGPAAEAQRAQHAQRFEGSTQRLRQAPEAPLKRPSDGADGADGARQQKALKPSEHGAPSGGSISESGARWVLKSSLDELLKAERLTETQSSKAAESTQIAAAMALLQHIWSSKYTEADLRSRLCQEAQKLLSLLENRLMKSAQGSQGSDTDAVARALMPCLRRAVALDIKIECQML